MTSNRIDDRRRGGGRAFRRGVASVMAMLYMVIFSALAIGFYAATTTSSQIAANERTTAESQVAAESGMQFIRHFLAQTSIPNGLSPHQAFEEVYMDLAGELDGTQNLNGGVVGYEPGLITVPQRGFINVRPGGPGFRARITQQGQRLAVTILARASANSQVVSLGRAIETDFAVAQNASNIFDFGVASRSSIALDGNATIKGAANAALGSVLSTATSNPAVSLGSNSTISGDISLVNPNGTVRVESNASIAGSKISAVYRDHIHKGVDEPIFPTIDTSAWEPYATNVLDVVGKKYDSGTLRNIRIKANTNPEFDSNMKVEGVIFVETPNLVKFNSNVEIRGVIVVQNNPTGSPGTGSGQNMISMSSNVKMYGVDTLPATADFPKGLRDLKGAAILAPRFYLHFNSNFGAVGGAIVGSKMEFDSNARGTIVGSVINLEETALHMDSNAVISIEGRGTTEYPAGVFFGYHYTPLNDTYREVRPMNF